MLTGRLPSQHRVNPLGTSVLGSEQTSVAEVLADAGYDTGAVVSNPVLLASRRLDQGFRHYDDRMTRPEQNRPQLHERTAEATTQAALEFIAAAAEPWFLWVHYQDPHGPYAPPETGPPTDPPGEEPLPLLRHHSGYGGIPAYQALEGARTARAYERAYTDEVRYLERHVGALLDLIERRYQPFLVVTSDHGEAFGEDDYWFAHGHSLGLDQIRVPLWVRAPETGSAEEVQARVEPRPISTAGVAATLIRAAGLTIPSEFTAPPIPFRADDQAPFPAEVVAEHEARLAVVIGNQYYARDRATFSPGRRDAVSGGVVWPFPPRTCELGTDGRASAYLERSPGRLASALAQHEAQEDASPESAGEPTGARLPRFQRSALEALGYLE